MNIYCSWLPEESQINLNNLPSEIDLAYNVFCNDFISSTPTFNGFPVRVRRYPEDKQKNRYFSFNHITTKDYSRINNKNSSEYTKREPDIRRIERIAWVRKIIEHPVCSPKLDCNCEGIKTWYEEYKGTYRVNIMLESENFMIVLEKENKDAEFYLLITAFYFNNDYEKNKRIKKYNSSTYKPLKL